MAIRPTLIRSSKAALDAISQLRAAYPSLPDSYLAFLEESDGAEGDLGVNPGWFVVWPATTAVRATNDYQIPQILPGFFAFGGNGGGELFVFSMKQTPMNSAVYMVPAIGMAVDELRLVAPSFEEFVAQFGKLYS